MRARIRRNPRDNRPRVGRGMDAIRVSGWSARRRHDGDHLFAKTWMTRSIKAPRHRDTKDNDVVAACVTIRRGEGREGGRTLALVETRWKSRRPRGHEGKKGGRVGKVEEGGRKSSKEHENRGRKTERRMPPGRRVRTTDCDSENARAKGYEMKFSSHPFCVSEGIPVRQEVASRNRRKSEEMAEGGRKKGDGKGKGKEEIR